MTALDQTEASASGASISNIFKHKREYLFLFGGVGDNGASTSAEELHYEVYDLGSGIWRKFEGASDKLGQVPFRVAHALPAAPDAKSIILVSHDARYRRLDVVTMHMSEVAQLALPTEEVHELITTVSIG